MSIKLFSKFSFLLCLLFACGQIALAEKKVSQCKGLDNAACDANKQCGWVDAYTRKDGKKVSAFCRTKAKNKSTAKATKKTT